MLDGRTVVVLGNQSSGRNPWQQIHAEVTDARQDFEDLRSWFAGLAATREGVALSLLRLHDILVWLHASEQWEVALGAGLRTW
jgi:hypothetical protein